MKKAIVIIILLGMIGGTTQAQTSRWLWKGIKGIWTVIETAGTVKDIYEFFSSEPEKASLSFTTDSKSPVNVHVNGNFVGQVSEYRTLGCSVSAGDISVSAVASDGTRWNQSFRLGAGAQQTVPFNGSTYDRRFKWIGEYGRFPEASQRYVSYSDLDRMSSWDLRIMRNEIYARRGYIFHVSREMQDYFDAQYWYRNVPKITEDGSYLQEYVFTEIEKENIKRIVAEEDSRR